MDIFTVLQNTVHNASLICWTINTTCIPHPFVGI